MSFNLGKEINKFELKFIDDYKEYDYPNDSDVTICVENIIKKWNF